MIEVVGNILKDVYLNLDSRTEPFETDEKGVKWLDFSFNSSRHTYFHRNSSFGGAAVTLEVLTKLGVKANVNGSDLTFEGGGAVISTPASSYRYILASDDGVSYLVGSQPEPTDFAPPAAPASYVFVDRSAHLTDKSAEKLRSYLDSNPKTRFIMYLRPENAHFLANLLPLADLVFVEKAEALSTALSLVNPAKIVQISEDALTYRNISERIRVDRIDARTHLSVFSIAAATILGGFILGKTVEESLRLARANVENARFDASLPLDKLEEAASLLSSSPELLATSFVRSRIGVPESLFLPQNLVLSLPDKSGATTNSLREAYDAGFRFVEFGESFTLDVRDGKITKPSPLDILNATGRLTSLARFYQNLDFVPIISVDISPDGNYSITKCAELSGQILTALFAAFSESKVDPKSLVIAMNFITSGNQYFEQSTPAEAGNATAEVIRRYLPQNLAGLVLKNGSPDRLDTAILMDSVLSDGPFPWSISLPPERLQA